MDTCLGKTFKVGQSLRKDTHDNDHIYFIYKLEKCMDAICAITKFTKSEARNTRNKFFDLSQLSIQRELILGNSISESICC